MKRLFSNVVVLTVFVALLSACSRRDSTISVADDDREMNAAIAKARETLPEFWRVFERHERGENEFSLKVRITDKGGAEHFWTGNIERRNGKIMGTIDNEPEFVKTVKNGQRIEIPEADISDWFYMRDKKMHGNYTLRVLLKQMPAGEAAKYRTILAEPE